MHQVGDQPRLYYDARSTNHQDQTGMFRDTTLERPRGVKLMRLPLYKKQFEWKFHFSLKLQMIRSERKDITYLVASAVARTCSYFCLEEEASTRSFCVGFGEFWCYECFREHWSMSYWTAHAVFLSRRAVRGTLFSSDTFSTSSHLFWGFHRAENISCVPLAQPPMSESCLEVKIKVKNLKCLCW